MIKALFISGLALVALVQLVISVTLFKLMRQPELPAIVARRKQLDKYSRTIQVVALLFVLVFILNWGLSK